MPESLRRASIGARVFAAAGLAVPLALNPEPEGVIALAILVVFSALLVLRLAQGRRPPCACFGSWSAKPLGWQHLVRNAVLIALAVVAAVA